MWTLLYYLCAAAVATGSLLHALRCNLNAQAWKHHFEHVGKQLAMSDAALARVDHENQVLRTRLDSALNRLYGTTRATTPHLLQLQPNVTAGVLPPRRHDRGWPTAAGQSVPRVPQTVGLAQSGGAAAADEARTTAGLTQILEQHGSFSEVLKRPTPDPAVILPPAGPVPDLQPAADDDPLPRGP